MHNFSNLEEGLSKAYSVVSNEIQKYIIADSALLSPFVAAILYSSLAKGKMVRPFLCLSWGKVFDIAESECLKLAVAIELIHVYSLIHDDLPAMDDDDLRRGKATLHKQYDEATAILAGDALQAKAFEIIATINTPNLAMIIGEFAKAIGLNGMVGGQYLDLSFEKIEPSKQDIVLMQSLKTGKLIEASCVLPTLLIDLAEKERDIVKSYSQNLGLAFQIKDDFLDLWGDAKQMGKANNKDSARQKGSLLSGMDQESANRLLTNKVEKCEELLTQLPRQSKQLKILTDLAYYVVARSN